MSSNFFKYLIFPVILLAAAFAIIFWVLLPLYYDAEATLELKKQNENNLSDRLKLTTNLEHLIGQYNERLSDITAFGKAIPEGQKVPELLINLEALASENGLTFSGVNFKPKDLKAAGVKTLVMEIKIKGSYPAFRNYLEALEKSLRIIDIMSVSFAGVGPGQVGAKIDNLEFNLIANTYYY